MDVPSPFRHHVHDLRCHGLLYYDAFTGNIELRGNSRKRSQKMRKTLNTAMSDHKRDFDIFLLHKRFIFKYNRPVFKSAFHKTDAERREDLGSMEIGSPLPFA